MRGINAGAWIGLFAPAGTPVIALLQKEIAAAAPELKWSKIIKDAASRRNKRGAAPLLRGSAHDCEAGQQGAGAQRIAPY